MTCVGILAFLSANKVQLLGAWLVLEQYLASNKNIKANSTLQLLLDVINALITTQKVSPSRTTRSQ